MLHSAEVRWFVPRALPHEILLWFNAGHPLESEDIRTDDYLLFPDCDSIGVKLREGKLEVKAMLSASRPVSWDIGISGRMDQWIKWSFDGEALPALDRALHQSGRWISVLKQRFLRRFSADTGSLVEVPTTQRPFPVTGCAIELSRIEVEAVPRFWFSLGFGAFGPPASTAQTLDETIRLFFREYGGVPGLTLTGRESLSYPAWLVTLV